MIDAGSDKLGILMDEWLSCVGDWKKSSLVQRMKLSKRTKKHGARVWLTQGQIEEKYKSAAIAQQIVDAKLSDPELAKTHVKAHEDAPDSEAGVVFFRS